MLSFFDRRKQRLERLASAIMEADDQSLAAVVAHAGADELAAVLGMLPVDRANRVCSGVAPERLEAALTRSLEGATPGEKTLAKLAGELAGRPVPRPTTAAGPAAGAVDGVVGASTSEPVPGTTPMCVKALDMAGKVFGTLTIQSKD